MIGFFKSLLGRVIDIEAFEQVVRDFFASQPNAGQSLVIALDGKTLRGTIAAGQTRGQHLLAAYLPAEGWVLLQVEVEGKENEITAAPRVLKCLDLRGKIVTGDAMFAQRELSLQIIEARGNYIWAGLWCMNRKIGVISLIAMIGSIDPIALRHLQVRHLIERRTTNQCLSGLRGQ
jgi:hypothetical protein